MKLSINKMSAGPDAGSLDNIIEDTYSDELDSREHTRIFEAIRETRQTVLKAHDLEKSDIKLWGTKGREFWRGTKSLKELPAGLYRCTGSHSVGPTLVKQNISVDEIVTLPSNVHDPLLEEFDKFWESKVAFNKRGFIHKRGIFLYGPPGSGKTSAIQLLVKDLVEKKNGIVMFVDNPRLAGECLQMIREIEPERPMIAIFEDLDALVQDYGENEYLALLDGEAQVDNIVFVATSNYPETLDPRFTDRPSRFDVIYLMDMPNDVARESYLKHKEPSLTKAERDFWVRQSEGFSIAHLKEVIVSVQCLGKDFNETIVRIKNMINKHPSSTELKSSKVGFFNKGR